MNPNTEANMEKLLEELNGAYMVRTDLCPDVVFAWYGGTYVEMLSTSTGEVVSCRGQDGLDAFSAEDLMVSWVKEMEG
jgi:hypothetical protein